MSSDSSDTRDAIFSAGLRILATEGHQGLTVRRVAAEAGCSTIGVYTWFGGKDGLIDAIWRDSFESFADALEGARPGRGPLARAKAQAKAYRDWAFAHPMHYQVMFLKAVAGFEPSAESAQSGARAYAALHGAIAESMAKGELRSTDVEAIATIMWSGVHGLVSLDLVGNRPATSTSDQTLSERSFHLMIDTLISGLTR
jgi:AcrR family transcriptional regulator